MEAKLKKDFGVIAKACEFNMYELQQMQDTRKEVERILNNRLDSDLRNLIVKNRIRNIYLIGENILIPYLLNLQITSHMLKILPDGNHLCSFIKRAPKEVR